MDAEDVDLVCNLSVRIMQIFIYVDGPPRRYAYAIVCTRCLLYFRFDRLDYREKVLFQPLFEVRNGRNLKIAVSEKLVNERLWGYTINIVLLCIQFIEVFLELWIKISYEDGCIVSYCITTDALHGLAKRSHIELRGDVGSLHKRVSVPASHGFPKSRRREVDHGVMWRRIEIPVAKLLLHIRVAICIVCLFFFLWFIGVGV